MEKILKTVRRAAAGLVAFAGVAAVCFAAGPADYVEQDSFGEYGWIAGQLNRPFAVALSSDAKKIYVVDTGACFIREFNREGVQTGRYGSYGGPGSAGFLHYPLGLALDAHGRFLVAGNASEAILVFSAGEMGAKAWGSAGSGPGQFARPQDVAVKTRLLLNITK